MTKALYLTLVGTDVLGGPRTTANRPNRSEEKGHAEESPTDYSVGLKYSLEISVLYSSSVLIKP